MKPLVILRYIGSFLLIIGYFILLNVDVFWGVLLRMIANAISLPWAIKNKIWDFVLLLLFFLVIEIAKFYSLVNS